MPVAAQAKPLVALVRPKALPRRFPPGLSRHATPTCLAPTVATPLLVHVRPVRRCGEDRARRRPGSGRLSPFIRLPFTGIWYNIYGSPGPGKPIAYDADPVAIVQSLEWTSGTLTVPGVCGFGVRAADANGEERNLDAAVSIAINAAGLDISNVPTAPVGLRAFATTGAGIRVEWTTSPAAGAKKPAGFHVYIGTAKTTSGLPAAQPGRVQPGGPFVQPGYSGSFAAAGGAPTPDYSTPTITVAADAAILGSYQANLSGLSDSTTYAIGVRAYNASGEESNTSIVTVTADGTGPLPVSRLTATPIA